MARSWPAMVLLALLAAAFCPAEAFTGARWAANMRAGAQATRRPVAMVSLPTRTPGKDGTAVIEKETVKKGSPLAVGDEASRNDGMYSVLIFNDEVNTREYVARCLVVVCGLAEGDAFSVMQMAHRDGYAVVGQWGSEVAEMYVSSLQQKGLQADMTEA